MLNIYFKKAREEAIIPQKSTSGSVGWDLYSPNFFILRAKERKTVMTGIQCKTEFTHPILSEVFDFWAEFKGCSGNAHKKGIEILGGCIDPDFRGDMGVILLNTSDEDIPFNKGDKLAQAVFVPHAKNEVMYEVNDLDETERGEKGFGHSGIAGEAKTSENEYFYIDGIKIITDDDTDSKIGVATIS
jgi:dUTP pyrophosphatase